MDFEVKDETNLETNDSKNDGFVDRISKWILDGFGEGFEVVLGEVWRLWALFGPTFGFFLWNLDHRSKGCALSDAGCVT